MPRRPALVRRFGAIGALTVLCVGTGAVCRGVEPREATLVMALGPGRAVVAGLAEAELAATAEGGAGVRIVFDTVPVDGTADEVARARRALEQPGVVAVVGHGNSRSTRAAAPLYAERGIPLVVPTSTSRMLHALPGVFLLAPDDSIEGAFMARFARGRLGAGSAVLFYHLDEYGQGLRAGIEAELARQGVTVLQQVGYHPTSDLEPLLEAALVRGRPDVLLVAGRTGDVAALARLAHARAPGLPVVAGDGALVGPALVEQAGAGADDLYVATFWHAGRNDARSREFVERFRRAAGREPDADRAMTYDAVMLTAEAIREAGPEPAAIARWLSELGRDRPPYRGITGPIAFGPGRVAPLVMVRVREGRVVATHGEAPGEAR